MVRLVQIAFSLEDSPSEVSDSFSFIIVAGTTMEALKKAQR